MVCQIFQFARYITLDNAKFFIYCDLIVIDLLVMNILEFLNLTWYFMEFEKLLNVITLCELFVQDTEV